MGYFGDCNFKLVSKISELTRTDYFKDDWLVALNEGMLIYNVYEKSTKEHIGLVGLEVSENNNFDLSLLEVFEEFRGNDFGLNIIAFCLDLVNKFVDAIEFPEVSVLVISSKANARGYYKKIGAVESESEFDAYYFTKESGKELISRFIG